MPPESNASRCESRPCICAVDIPHPLPCPAQLPPTYTRLTLYLPFLPPQCEAPKGASSGTAASAKFLPGDWTCPDCGSHNFASRMACFKVSVRDASILMTCTLLDVPAHLDHTCMVLRTSRHFFYRVFRCHAKRAFFSQCGADKAEEEVSC